MSFTVSLGEQVSLSKDVFRESKNECQKRENFQKSKFLKIPSESDVTFSVCVNET